MSKLPLPATRQKWKKVNKYLEFTNDSMRCSLCIKYENRLCLNSKNFSANFIEGCRNFKKSSVLEHVNSNMHKEAEEMCEAEKAKINNIRISKDLKVGGQSDISKAFSKAGKMSKQQKEGIEKLFDVAYNIAKKGRPFTDFEYDLKLEKLHEVEFMPNDAYENHMACKDFIEHINLSIFSKELKPKIERANFIG